MATMAFAPSAVACAAPAAREFNGLKAATNFGKVQSVAFLPTSVAGKGALGARCDLQRWERKEVKDNSLPIRQTLHVKVGDTVQVITGSDKKKVGEVVRIFTHNSKILVKNINFKTKHIKGKAEGESGQIIQVEAPIHSSNVMLYSKEKKVASRIGHKTLEDGRKVRYLVKTGEVLDKPEDWKKIYKKEKKEKK